MLPYSQENVTGDAGSDEESGPGTPPAKEEKKKSLSSSASAADGVASRSPGGMFRHSKPAHVSVRPLYVCGSPLVTVLSSYFKRI